MVLESRHASTLELPASIARSENGIPGEWARALDRFHRHALQLQRAYGALEDRLRALNLELEQANRELQENLKEKERLQSYLGHILHGLSVGVIVTDRDGRVTLANRAARELLSLEGKQEGQRAEHLLSSVLPADDLGHLMAVPSNEEITIERAHKRAEGGASLHLTIRSRRLQDPHGIELGVLITLEDFTDMRAMEEEVARSQRLAAMGEMAVNIAHEVRNPLGSIQLFASLLADEPSARARDAIKEQIHSAIASVDHILANLLVFARPREPRIKPVPLADLLAHCMGFLHPLAKQCGIRTHIEAPHGRYTIEADENLLKQAFLNCFLNSVQAMPDGGTLSCTIRETPADRCRRIETTRGETARFVEIEIEDTGEGIPGDVLPRIFDPFFTTRQEGTGLGLAIVHGIVKAHGGSIRVHSEPGSGTTVIMLLPVSARQRGLDQGGRR